MKKQIEKLAALNLDLELFYTISLWDYEIRLQGFATKSTLSALKSNGFDFIYDAEYEFFTAKNDEINIILTFKN